MEVVHEVGDFNAFYRGADKSLARTGMKQARKNVRDARDSVQHFSS